MELCEFKAILDYIVSPSSHSYTARCYLNNNKIKLDIIKTATTKPNQDLMRHLAGALITTPQTYVSGIHIHFPKYIAVKKEHQVRP